MNPEGPPTALSPEEAAELLPPAGDDTYDARGKSPERIAEDIAATRAELAHILTELEHRLAPQQLLERGMDMLKDTMEGGAGGVGEMLRRHPVPLALIGVGVGWIAVAMSARAAQGDGSAAYSTATSGFAHAREKAGGTMDRAQQTLSDTASRAQEMAGRAQQALGDTAGRAQEGMRTAWRQANHLAEQAADRLTKPRRRFGEWLSDNPLLLGAVGLAVGAAAAFLLPRSAAEERLVRPAGEPLRDQAEGLGREAVTRAQHVAESTIEAATDAAKSAVREAADAARPEHGEGEEQKG